MDPYILLLFGGGLLILLVAWLPMALKSLPLSMPMICVGLGFGLFHVLGGEQPLPLRFPMATERLTEIIVIVALMGSGAEAGSSAGLAVLEPDMAAAGDLHAALDRRHRLDRPCMAGP